MQQGKRVFFVEFTRAVENQAPWLFNTPGNNIHPKKNNDHKLEQ